MCANRVDYGQLGNREFEELSPTINRLSKLSKWYFSKRSLGVTGRYRLLSLSKTAKFLGSKSAKKPKHFLMKCLAFKPSSPPKIMNSYVVLKKQFIALGGYLNWCNSFASAIEARVVVNRGSSNSMAKRSQRFLTHGIVSTVCDAG